MSSLKPIVWIKALKMDNSEVSRFHVVDYIVFCGMLVVSLGIGLYQGCKGDRQRTTQQYLMADRKLQLIPATLSIAGKSVNSGEDSIKT